jgi:hypothetical protein
VRRLLRELGDTDEHRALGERIHRTSERLESGNADAAAKAKFADLSLAVHHLKLQAHDKFYTKTEGSPTVLTADNADHGSRPVNHGDTDDPEK